MALDQETENVMAVVVVVARMSLAGFRFFVTTMIVMILTCEDRAAG